MENIKKHGKNVEILVLRPGTIPFSSNFLTHLELGGQNQSKYTVLPNTSQTLGGYLTW